MSKPNAKGKHVTGKALGGRARAEALPADRRSEISRQAALSRWDPGMPYAEHDSGDHPLRIGGIELPCYVLNNGTRAFSQRGLMEAVGLSVRGGQIEALVSALGAQLPAETTKVLTHPLQFRRKGGGPLVHAYPATSLVDVCNAIIAWQKSGGLSPRLKLLGDRAQMIVSAVAKTGIIALVDEATGYARHEALQALLDRYLRHELALWAKRFPDEFYEHIFRLKGWEWKGRAINPPWAVGTITKDLIYARLGPGILKELEKRNPRIGKHRKGKHTQLLTEDVGIPALQSHIAMIVGFERVADTWDGLMAMVNRALPRKEENMDLPLLEWGKEQQGAA
jgi:hypothetical protein